MLKLCYCNESGKWITFKSDRYGFNNPDKFWDNPYFLTLGDSFTQGDCVERSNNISSILTKLTKKKTLNLGYGGNGPLIELATLIEYSKVISPKHIIWFFYEGNDPRDLHLEKMDSTLVKYLRDDSFSQDLVNKQILIDDLLKEYSKKIIKNYNTQSKIILFIDFIKLRKVRNFFYKENFLVDETFTRVFKKGKKISEKLNSKFTVIIIPSYERYREKKSLSLKQKKIQKLDLNVSLLEKILKEEKIEFINLNKELFSKNGDPLSFYVFRYNNHFNEKGYIKISNFIHNYLK